MVQCRQFFFSYQSTCTTFINCEIFAPVLVLSLSTSNFMLIFANSSPSKGSPCRGCLYLGVPHACGELKAIQQQNRATPPGKRINASPLSDSQYKQVHCLLFKKDNEQLSCQRYRICNELGVNPQQLTEEDCDIWLNVGLPTLTCFSAARGFEVTEDCTDTPLCHRKFESMLQKYLHYLLEPILKDDYIFKDFWSRKEASEIVERIMAMDENAQRALQRLRLIPGSMIAGIGSHQTIIRPKNSTDYVNNYLLANRLGLKHSSCQQCMEQKREWRYKICEKPLFIMTRYAEQRAKAHGLKQVSRVEGKLLSTVSAGQPVETFVDWYEKRWGVRLLLKQAVLMVRLIR